MFKKLALAAALAACFASAAQAQAQGNVTIYGRINTTVERLDLDGQTSTTVRNNASRIGFKGSEDIGNGLKANFVIEHGFESDTGAQSTGSNVAGTFWGREATVGLSSANFGAVRIGNMPASEAYFATADYVSMHNHDTGTSSDALYALGFQLATLRLTNTVAYTSPTINGFRGDVQVGLRDGGAGEGDRRVALAGNYDAGPLHLGAGYEEFNGLKSLTIRGLYEMGPWTFGGYIESDSGSADVDALSNALLATDAKRTNIRVSAMYVMGIGEFHANYGKAGKIGSTADSGADQYTLGYNYNLSKRTKVYGYYTAIKSDSQAAAKLYAAFDAAQLGVRDFSSFAVGLRHNF